MTPPERSPLTLDADVARLIDDEVHRSRRTREQVVNDAIRNGLSPRPERGRPVRYRVVPHRTALRAGVDRARLNQIADELDDFGRFAGVRWTNPLA